VALDQLKGFFGVKPWLDDDAAARAQAEES
jgi:hypothetical protein